MLIEINMNDKIRRALVNPNPWWKGTWNIDYKERELEKEIDKYLKH